jgi:ABC-type nitrate/sulfonate/bicarbonate transport system substrate-binding protein
MSLSKLVVMYGHIDGAQGKFPRDPSGHLAVKAGIFQKNGLEVSWQHVQGTEERYRKIEDGSAQISFVVGRAALQHFLSSRKTRILGSSMNSCPYYLVSDRAVAEIAHLKGKAVACLEGVGRSAPLTRCFREQGLSDSDLRLKLAKSDQDALDLLIRGEVQAALLPRPYGFLAAEKGFGRISAWPDVVDDPLPVMIETTEALLREREKDFAAFVTAHREVIRYLKLNRAETIRMLGERFGHSAALAGKAYDEYLVWLEDRLTINFRKLQELVTQVAPDLAGSARQLAAEWIVPGVVRG